MKTKIFKSMDACYEYFGEDLQIPSDTVVIVHDTDNPNEIYSTIIPYNGQNIILKGASITSIPREGAFEHITVIHPITGEEVEYTYVGDEEDPDEPEDPTTEDPTTDEPTIPNISMTFGHPVDDAENQISAAAEGYLTETNEETGLEDNVGYFYKLSTDYSDGYVFNIIYGDPDEDGNYTNFTVTADGSEPTQTASFDYTEYNVVQVRFNIDSEAITRSDSMILVEWMFNSGEVTVYIEDKEGEFDEPEDPTTDEPVETPSYNAANVYLINSDDEREAVNLSTEALADFNLVVSAEALGKTVEELEEMGYAETGEEIGMVKVTEDEAATNEDDYYAAYTIIAKPESDPIDGVYTFEIELNNPDSNVFTDEIYDAGNVHEFNNDYTEGAGVTHFTFGLESSGNVYKGFKFTVPEDYHFAIEIFYNPENYTFTFTEYGYQPDNGSEEE